MADERTKRLIRRHDYAKTYFPFAAGASVGALLMLCFGYSPIAIYAQAAGLFGVVAPSAANEIARTTWGGWLAAPILGGLLTSWLSRAKPLQPLLEHMWPRPPSFTRSDIAAERLAMVDLIEANPVPIIGRLVELGRLLRFLETKQPFAWQVVSGPTGIGKTRLGVEWLLRCHRAGWDVGFVDARDIALLENWTPRRRSSLSTTSNATGTRGSAMR